MGFVVLVVFAGFRRCSGGFAGCFAGFPCFFGCFRMFGAFQKVVSGLFDAFFFFDECSSMFLCILLVIGFSNFSRWFREVSSFFVTVNFRSFLKGPLGAHRTCHVDCFAPLTGRRRGSKFRVPSQVSFSLLSVVMSFRGIVVAVQGRRPHQMPVWTSLCARPDGPDPPFMAA